MVLAFVEGLSVPTLQQPVQGQRPRQLLLRPFFSFFDRQRTDLRHSHQRLHDPLAPGLAQLNRLHLIEQAVDNAGQARPLLLRGGREERMPQEGGPRKQRPEALGCQLANRQAAVEK